MVAGDLKLLPATADSDLVFGSWPVLISFSEPAVRRLFGTKRLVLLPPSGL